MLICIPLRTFINVSNTVVTWLDINCVKSTPGHWKPLFSLHPSQSNWVKLQDDVCALFQIQVGVDRPSQGDETVAGLQNLTDPHGEGKGRTGEPSVSSHIKNISLKKKLFTAVQY